MNEEITQDVYFTRGYQKGFSDAQESLARKMSKTIMDDRDAGYDQGVKDCYKILKEQLDEMIENCRFQDEYGLKLVRDKLFNKNEP
jgi:hypothetical protein